MFSVLTQPLLVSALFNMAELSKGKVMVLHCINLHSCRHY